MVLLSGTGATDLHLLQTRVCTKLIMVLASPVPLSKCRHALCTAYMAFGRPANPSSFKSRLDASSLPAVRVHSLVTGSQSTCQETKKYTAASCRM